MLLVGVLDRGMRAAWRQERETPNGKRLATAAARPGLIPIESEFA
jgi:hypothetical protein